MGPGVQVWGSLTCTQPVPWPAPVFLQVKEAAQRRGCVRGEVRRELLGSAFHTTSSSVLLCPGELNSRLNSDTKLMSSWLPLNANVLLRSLVKVVGLYSFMLNLSPRLTLLSLLEVPLTIAAEKVYGVRHQVCVAVGHPRKNQS